MKLCGGACIKTQGVAEKSGHIIEGERTEVGTTAGAQSTTPMAASDCMAARTEERPTPSISMSCAQWSFSPDRSEPLRISSTMESLTRSARFHVPINRGFCDATAHLT